MTKPIPPLTYAYLGVLLTTFFWGTNFNVGAYVIQTMPPITAGAERFVIATILLLMVLGLMGKLRLSTLRRNLGAFIALGVFSVVGFNMAMFIGLHTTTAVNGALIMATTPLSTLVLSALIEHEKITRDKAIGIFCGLVGVVLVITHGNIAHLLQLNIAVGDLIILAGSLSWSLSTVISRRYVVDATAQETASYAMLFGTIGLVILALTFEQPLHSITQMPLNIHIAVLYMATFGSMIAYLLWFNGVQQVGSARATAFMNFVPVFTMLISILSGVLPNVWQLLGTAAIIVGVVITSGVLKAQPPAAASSR